MEQPEPVETPNLSGLTQNQKIALVALSGMAFVVVVLSFVTARRRTAAGDWTTGMDTSNQGWQESVRHLAGAIDMRFAGIEQQLDAIRQGRVQPTGTLVTETVPNIVPPVTNNGNSPVATPMVGADINDTPPKPASTSM